MRPLRTCLILLKQKVKDRKPEDFETILARCLADLTAGRVTIEDCLQRYPAQAGRLAAILPFAEQARATPLPDQSSMVVLPVSPLKP